MSQKINGVEPRPIAVTGGAPVPRPRDVAAESRNEAARAQTDVHITDSARQLASLEKVITALPVVDSKRTEKISRDIADGRYKIDPEAIADKLTRLEAQISNAQSRKK